MESPSWFLAAAAVEGGAREVIERHEHIITILAVVAFAWLVVAGVQLWRYRRLYREMEESLRRLSTGHRLEKEPKTELGHLMRRVEDRQAVLLNEVEDTRFDLHAIMAGIEDGVLVSDHRHFITLVNPALLEIFGLKTDPIGQTVLATLRLPILQTMLEGVVHDGAPQQAEILLEGRPHSVHLVMSAAPLRDAADLPGAVVVVRDVSRLRQLEEMRRAFVADVSHELRTPLSIFHGHLENLLEAPEMPREEVHQSLQIMRKHSLRLNTLVEDLLTLARLESGRDLLEPEPVEAGEFLEEVRRDWEPRGQARGLQVAVEIAPGLPELSADPFKLRQVLDNLLDNAMKHTAEGGAVTLRAAPGQNGSTPSRAWVDVSVEDTGAGIPREDLPHIFQRFYRADKARSRDMGGTGLGLAIVKHIAQAHGGSVRAESEVKKGTRIIVHLPSVEPAR